MKPLMHWVWPMVDTCGPGGGSSKSVGVEGREGWRGALTCPHSAGVPAAARPCKAAAARSAPNKHSTAQHSRAQRSGHLQHVVAGLEREVAAAHGDGDVRHLVDLVAVDHCERDKWGSVGAESQGGEE